MNFTQAQNDFIEGLIRECPGYRGHEFMHESFCKEVIQRSTNLVEGHENLEPLKVYIKRIANAAIMEVLKTSITTPQPSKENSEYRYGDSYSDDFCREFEESAAEFLNYDISSDSLRQAEVLSPKQAERVKSIICEMNNECTTSFFMDIYEHRYINGLNNPEIAALLEIEDSEVDSRLLSMLNRIK